MTRKVSIAIGSGSTMVFFILIISLCNCMQAWLPAWRPLIRRLKKAGQATDQELRAAQESNAALNQELWAALASVATTNREL
jgi:hypothetical protein